MYDGNSAELEVSFQLSENMALGAGHLIQEFNLNYDTVQ